jgi:hypothetical protein
MSQDGINKEGLSVLFLDAMRKILITCIQKDETNNDSRKANYKKIHLVAFAAFLRLPSTAKSINFQHFFLLTSRTSPRYH